MMGGRVAGTHMTTVIIPPALSLLQRVLPLLQVHHHHQKMVLQHQAVVTQHLHQPVVAQLQMFITLPQVILTTHHSVQITRLQLARQLVQHMVVMLHQSNSILVILRWCLFKDEAVPC